MELRLKDHLCARLYIASRLIVQAYGEELRDTKLTYLRYLVLLALKEKDEQTVNELGELLSLDSGTLSPLLKGLQADRYIERNRLLEDERIVVNRLTPKGRIACAKASEVAYRLFEETCFSKKRFKHLRKEMDAFVERCQEMIKSRKHGATIKNSKSLKSKIIKKKESLCSQIMFQ